MPQKCNYCQQVAQIQQKIARLNEVSEAWKSKNSANLSRMTEIEQKLSQLHAEQKQQSSPKRASTIKKLAKEQGNLRSFKLRSQEQERERERV